MSPRLAFAGRSSPPRREPVLGFLSDPVTCDTLARVLEEMHLAPDLAVEGGVMAALRAVEPETAPRILVIDIAKSDTPVADVAALAAAGTPDMRIIAIGTTNDVALFRDLMAAGVADYLVKPISRPAMQAALLEGRAGRETASAATAARSARTLVFIGSRGGIGATSCAVSTAWLLAEECRQRVGLIDFDLQFGTIALALDLEPGRGLREALERPSRIDSLFIERAMEKVSERLFVLGGEEPLQDELSFDPTAPDVLLHELKQKFDWVVIDLPRGTSLAHQQVLSAASDVILVCDLSLAGMRDTIRLHAMARETVPNARIWFMAGGADGARKTQITPADFERNVGKVLECQVPHDAAAAMAASNAGKPLPAVAKASRAGQALARFAHTLAGEAPPKPGKLFWQRLLKKG